MTSNFEIGSFVIVSPLLHHMNNNNNVEVIRNYKPKGSPNAWKDMLKESCRQRVKQQRENLLKQNREKMVVVSGLAPNTPVLICLFINLSFCFCFC